MVKPDPEDQSKVSHPEFDLEKFQVLLLFPVALKFSLLLSSNNSKATEVMKITKKFLKMLYNIIF